MAFQRPTLPELVDRIQSDFVSRLQLVGAVLRRALVFVLSRVIAGAAHMLHGHLEYLSRQLFPDTSDPDVLLRQAALFGMAPNGAAFATGTIPVTGTNGTVVPSLELLKRSDGAEFQTTGSATISSGTASVPVTAVLAGAAGNCDIGVALTFESPISGVNALVTLSSAISGGADQEDVGGSFRSRFIDRMSLPPSGGANSDYVAWARRVAGVTRAWVYPQELGAGTVTVRFMRDADTVPIPDSGEVATVQAYINARRPVTATVTVAAPVAAPIALTIHLNPDTTATRAAVQAELGDMISRDASPGGTIYLSQIRTAIGNAAGLTDYALTVPAADVTNSTGHISTLGTITYV